MNRLLACLMAILLGSFASPAAAQPAAEPLRARAEEIVALINGSADPAAMFTPDFLREIPATQLRGVADQLRAQHGAARRVERIEPTSPTTAGVRIEAERAVIRMVLAIEVAPPHRIQGLVVTGADVPNDTFEAVAAELRLLPGRTAFAVARLGGESPAVLAAHQPDEALAIGSTFKLLVLAELSRQVQAGERSWGEVVALDRASLPSGILQSWPRGAPLTLHSLAALMVSMSDNTATDILLHRLGRENVERMQARVGIAAPARNRPFLSTLEAFALKAAPDPAYAAWRAADEAGRRALLRAEYSLDDAARLPPGRSGTAPNRLDLEWFASAADLVRVMDWFRREADPIAREILAISPGMAPTAAAELAYVGYKGGSEPGVLNLTWLVRNRSGAWHVVTGSWNNPDGGIEEGRFADLLRRAVQLVR